MTAIVSWTGIIDHPDYNRPFVPFIPSGSSISYENVERYFDVFPLWHFSVFSRSSAAAWYAIRN